MKNSQFGVKRPRVFLITGRDAARAMKNGPAGSRRDWRAPVFTAAIRWGLEADLRGEAFYHPTARPPALMKSSPSRRTPASPQPLRRLIRLFKSSCRVRYVCVRPIQADASVWAAGAFRRPLWVSETLVLQLQRGGESPEEAGLPAASAHGNGVYP